MQNTQNISNLPLELQLDLAQKRLQTLQVERDVLDIQLSQMRIDLKHESVNNKKIIESLIYERDKLCERIQPIEEVQHAIIELYLEMKDRPLGQPNSAQLEIEKQRLDEQEQSLIS
ncbi:MAG: hypothetical protein EZS28_050904 [Streblomastix strix]|uniref:Uncharacterized protein n=1 Tax=Streblomastix strix TaxID=222440 RepID=A0A5J4T5A1_9EUKA|nr:MAG: hypothetical protein EZS28_050904 [Streblomastix strix]